MTSNATLDLEPLKIERSEPAKKSSGHRRPGWPRLTGPLVVVLLLGGLFFLFQAPITGFVDRLRLPEVRTQRVVKNSAVAAAAVSGASANGYIVAKTRAALSADTPGRIVEMNVQEGSVVRKGDVVARLYSDEYAALLRRAEAELSLSQAGHTRAEAELKVAENDLSRLASAHNAAGADLEQFKAARDLAELEYKRAEDLLASKVSNVQQRDQAKSLLDSAKARVTWAEAQLESARIAVTQGESQIAVSKSAVSEALARLDVARASRDQAQATLEKTAVRAPFDGIVVLKDAEVGEVVSPNSQGGTSARGSVVTMVDFASLEVQAEVPETNLAAVVTGASAQVYLDAFPDKPYKGHVDRIWPTANRTKATVEVRVAFEERDDRLRPEMGVRIVFIDPNADRPAAPTDGELAAVILIPSEAVVRIQGENGVFVLERDVVHFKKLALGEQRSGKVIVQNGLAEGDVIVLAPSVSLKDGDRVRVKS